MFNTNHVIRTPFEITLSYTCPPSFSQLSQVSPVELLAALFLFFLLRIRGQGKQLQAVVVSEARFGFVDLLVHHVLPVDAEPDDVVVLRIHPLLIEVVVLKQCWLFKSGD